MNIWQGRLSDFGSLGINRLSIGIQSLNDELSKRAIDQLSKLQFAQAHSSCLLHTSDLRTFNKLGINTTEESISKAKKIYTKEI